VSGQRRTENGFVLVGVVIFVLALTILGMSLYAISGYEAGFLGQSHDDTLALYQAQGGMEMVRQILAQPADSLGNYLLSAAHQVEGVEGIVRATAFQGRTGGAGLDSIGRIDFSSDSAVRIVVTATVGANSRRLSGSFVPQASQDFYRRLFTVGGTLTSIPGPAHTFLWTTGSIYIDRHSTSSAFGTVHLGTNSRVAESSSRPGWTGQVTWDDNARNDSVATVPAPNVQAFYTAHPPAFAPTVAGEVVTFGQSSPQPVYYGPPLGGGPDYSLDMSAGNPELDVQGTVVWELPAGFRSENSVRIKNIGSGTATLVIVASPNPARSGQDQDPSVGIWFWTGLYVDAGSSVNVILVSDGQVNIEPNNSVGTSYSIPRLSIFCRSLYLQGPDSSTGLEYLFSHDPAMDPDILTLESEGALPTANSVTPAAFTLIRGSWQDATP